MQYTTINPVTGQRLINGAWVGTQTALAILQVRVLFQALTAAPRAWQHEGEGFLIAGLSMVWLLGSALGKRWSRGPNAGYWGGRTLFLSIVWIIVPRLSMNWPHLTGVPSPLVPDLLFALLAMLLGLCGSAWLAAVRPQWPAASEGIQQATNLCGIPLALVVVYLWANWSGWLALAALAPLLAIDSYPSARCPFPQSVSWQQGQRLRWQTIDEEWLAATSISIDRRSLPFGWWRWLSRYTRLPLTLLVSFVTIVLSAVWWIVPTAFAWELLTHRQLAILASLVGGQAIALALTQVDSRAAALAYLLSWHILEFKDEGGQSML